MSYSHLGALLPKDARKIIGGPRQPTMDKSTPKLAVFPLATRPKLTFVIGSGAKTPPPSNDKPPPVEDKPPPAEDAWDDWSSDGSADKPPPETPAFDDSQDEAAEPSALEPLVPQPKKNPWPWIALGLTATALLGYALYKPVKPNRRR